jgi:hypothetical protein
MPSRAETDALMLAGRRRLSDAERQANIERLQAMVESLAESWANSELEPDARAGT